LGTTLNSIYLKSDSEPLNLNEEIVKIPPGFILSDENKNIAAHNGFSLRKGCILKKNEFEFKVDSDRDFEIFNEIFLRNSYSFFGTLKGEFIVFDVGFNIGAAAIYFSLYNNVSKVYGFEPFPETLELGRQNLLLNPKIKEKVRIFEFGLSDKNKKKKILYDKERKPDISTFHENKKNFNKNVINPERLSKCKKISIKLKKASNVIFNILKKQSHKKVLLKIDCEGAEYEILPDLYQNKVLEKVDAVILEWHHNDGGQELKNILLKSGFKTIIHDDLNKMTGFIYAKKIL
jgi:FkbM family methyltransferase